MSATPQRRFEVAALCALSVLSLFLGFSRNSWRVAVQQWFEGFQRDTESLIIGRMVLSRERSILSSGALTGWGSTSSTNVDMDTTDLAIISNQYEAYVKGEPFKGYGTYDSQIGGQGIFFAILDKLIGLSPDKKLRFFHDLTSLLSALTLTAIILWFYWEFGLTVALFVLASAIFSQWLVAFGRNLWWSLWAFYIPVAAVMHYLRFRRDSDFKPFALDVTVFIVVFIKCFFNGYEYITTALVMMSVPILYYGVLKKLSWQKFLSTFVRVALSSCLAILVTFFILCVQIGSVKGSLKDGVHHIVYAFAVRTHANPNEFRDVYTSSLQAGTFAVLSPYLKGTFFDPNVYLTRSRFLPRIHYYRLIIIFALSSGMAVALTKNANRDERRKTYSLILATWFSILAPLSWFVIFKAHSYIHTHMNFIVWQMPFVLFGFAVCGLVVEASLRRIALLRPIGTSQENRL